MLSQDARFGDNIPHSKNRIVAPQLNITQPLETMTYSNITTQGLPSIMLREKNVTEETCIASFHFLHNKFLCTGWYVCMCVLMHA